MFTHIISRKRWHFTTEEPTPGWSLWARFVSSGRQQWFVKVQWYWRARSPTSVASNGKVNANSSSYSAIFRCRLSNLTDAVFSVYINSSSISRRSQSVMLSHARSPREEQRVRKVFDDTDSSPGISSSRVSHGKRWQLCPFFTSADIYVALQISLAVRGQLVQLHPACWPARLSGKGFLRLKFAGSTIK